MNYEKYKLPEGIAIAISLFFIAFFRYASPSSSIVVGSILFAIWTIVLIVYIIGRKKIKSKLLFAGIICLFLMGLISAISDYFDIHKINDHYLILLMPILLIVFIQVSHKVHISHLKDEKKIKKDKASTVFSIIILLGFEVIALYGVFVLHR